MKVQRSEILDYETYEEQRDEIRASAMEAKNRRRIHLGENLTFLFESHETVRYQILEMVRIERIVREADIQHEIDTYNELIGENGDVGCTLLIEIEDPEDRATLLAEWVGLPSMLYLETEDGTRIHARPDERQNEDAKISSVQFLMFPLGGKAPIAIGSEHPRLTLRQELTEEQSEAISSV
ncbi:MAG: DUF3501 family protein [Pyrinomonadaceae bacterium]